MNRRERWIMTVSLTIGMLLMLVLAGTGAINFGGALAQDSPSTVARLQEATATPSPRPGPGRCRRPSTS